MRWKTIRKPDPSDLAVWGLVVAVAVAIIYFLQLRQMSKQTIAAQQSLQDIEAQTVISERPWLDVGVEPAGDLVFPNGQAAMNLKYSIRNFGKSIAQRVQIDVKFRPASPGLIASPDAPRIQQELCDNPKPQGIGTFEVIPEDRNMEPDPEQSVSTTKADLDLVSQTAASDPTRRFVGLYIVGCVTYYSSFEKNPHQTRFAYRVRGPVGPWINGKPFRLSNGMFNMGDFEVGKKVPKDEIGMTKELFGNNGHY